MKKKLFTLLLVLILALTGCRAEQTISKNESKTLQWFNAVYAVITTRNEADITLVGGYEKTLSNTVMMKESLKEYWDVTDRETADTTLEWLLYEGGHNAELLEVYDQNSLSDFTRDELMETLSDSSYTDSDRVYYLGIYDVVTTYGDNAIVAWDLSRAMQLCAWYYIAGYYTFDEAMDSSLEIAETLQNTYNSWDDTMQSYFYGFQYWNDDDMNDETSESYARKQVYEDLKKMENGPYSLDWNFELQKDW